MNKYKIQWQTPFNEFRGQINVQVLINNSAVSSWKILFWKCKKPTSLFHLIILIKCPALLLLSQAKYDEVYSRIMRLINLRSSNHVKHGIGPIPLVTFITYFFVLISFYSIGKFVRNMSTLTDKITFGLLGSFYTCDKEYNAEHSILFDEADYLYSIQTFALLFFCYRK